MNRPAQPLLRLLAQGFDVRSWHGPNLMGSLRGVTPELAVYRPQPERHNVWELMVHAAYWKYRVVRLLPGEAPSSFGVAGSDFFPRPASDADWDEDLARLRVWHQRLCAAVSALTAAELEEKPGKSEFSRWEVVAGVAAHDVYHAGQIQLLKRMAKAS